MPLDPGDIRITAGAIVDLRYQGKTVSVRVTEVIEPQSIFLGEVEAFDTLEFEYDGLSSGDTVRFAYDSIQHIHKWVEDDQP